MIEYTNEKAPNKIVFYKDDGRLAANTMKLEPSDEVLKELYRLRAENEKLRAALKPFADEAQRVLSDMPDSIYWDDITVGMLRAAAAALKGTSDERRNRQATSDISRTPSS